MQTPENRWKILKSKKILYGDLGSRVWNPFTIFFRERRKTQSVKLVFVRIMFELCLNYVVKTRIGTNSYISLEVGAFMTQKRLFRIGFMYTFKMKLRERIPDSPAQVRKTESLRFLVLLTSYWGSKNPEAAANPIKKVEKMKIETTLSWDPRNARQEYLWKVSEKIDKTDPKEQLHPFRTLSPRSVCTGFAADHSGDAHGELRLQRGGMLAKWKLFKRQGCHVI